MDSRLRLIESQVQRLHKSADAAVLTCVLSDCLGILQEDPLWAVRRRVHKLLWKECIYAPLNSVRKELKSAMRAGAAAAPQVTRCKTLLTARVAEGQAALRTVALAIESRISGAPGKSSAPSDVEALVGAHSLVCVYQGDCARYVGDLSCALERYHHAALLEPESGYPQNQLAVTARELNCRPLLWYHYARAAAAPTPFAGVLEELANIGAESHKTYAAAAVDSRIRRLGSLGSRDLRRPDALIQVVDKGAAVTTRILARTTANSSMPETVDLQQLMSLYHGTALPAAAASVCWVLGRVVFAAATLRKGSDALSALPLITKQLCTDVGRLLAMADPRDHCMDAATDPCLPTSHTSLQLTPMWLVRVLAILVNAHSAAANVESAGHALVFIFELASCVAKHCRSLLLNSRRRPRERRSSNAVDAPVREDDTGNLHDGDDASDKSTEELKDSPPKTGAGISPCLPAPSLLIRVADLLAPLCAFADWAAGHLEELQGAAELSSPALRTSTVAPGLKPVDSEISDTVMSAIDVVRARRRVLAALAALTNSLSSCLDAVPTADLADPAAVVLLEEVELQGCPLFRVSSAQDWQVSHASHSLAGILAKNELAASVGGPDVTWAALNLHSGAFAAAATASNQHASTVLRMRSAKIRKLMLALSALPGCRVTYSSSDGAFRTSSASSQAAAARTRVGSTMEDGKAPSGDRSHELTSPAVACAPSCPPQVTFSAAPSASKASDDLVDGEVIIPISALLTRNSAL